MANNAVAIKLPTFWSEQPRIWFTQAEAQFAIRNITSDDTKYYHVVAALDQTTAKRVVSVLENPPETDKYKALKDTLLDTYGLSDDERASQLLHLPGLGDAKPSELMDNMMALLGKHTPCFLFRQLFVEQMPADMRSHLARIEIGDYRALAREADKLWNSRSSTSCDVITDRKQQRQSYKRHVNPHANTQRKHPTPASEDISSSDNSECYYHRRFGVEARQCRPPCSFPGNDQADRR